jgi:CheY-like chemotaxis protein
MGMKAVTMVLEHAPLAPGTPPLVLVADDDPAITRLLEMILEGDGFRVAIARDGNAALSLARKARPDAILLDIMMPGMNGWAVLAALRSDPWTADIPVIVVSACEDRNDRAVALHLDGVDYVVRPNAVFTKPFDAFSLVGAIKTALLPNQTRLPES